MSDQVDIAVDLGVVPPPLPEIEFLREFGAKRAGAAAAAVWGILLFLAEASPVRDVRAGAEYWNSAD